MAQVGLLGLVQIGEQAPRRLDGGPVPLGDGLQPRPELLLHQGQGGVVPEAPLSPVLTHAVQLVPQKVGEAVQVIGPVGQHRLGGVEPAQLVVQVVPCLLPGGEGGAEHLAGGQVAQAQADGGGVGVDGAQEVVLPLLQHGGGHDGARGDHPDDVPVHQPLGGGRVLGLLADGHLVPLGDEPGDVAVAGVVGHPAHGGALLRGLAPVPGGEGQIQLPGGQLGVVEEHLVKIAQPEK